MIRYIQQNLIKSVLLVFTLNFLATFFHWYRLVWWFDMLMHFLGGVFVAWLVLYIYFKIFEGKQEIIFDKKLFKKIIISALIIGLGWEWFEWGTDFYTGANDMHLLDSYSDLFFDTAGAMFMALVLKIKVFRTQSEMLK